MKKIKFNILLLFVVYRNISQKLIMNKNALLHSHCTENTPEVTAYSDFDGSLILAMTSGIDL